MAVTSISALVDSATFQRWNSALLNLQREVQIPVTVVSSIPSLPLPRRLGVTGLELLLEIGVACARPSSLDDPARLFGLFRYATALSPLTNELALDRQLRFLDRHKKGVLSDEFGCGMACMVARRFGGVDHFLDLSDAVRRRWVRTTAPTSRQPDYAGLVRGSNVLVVLEAKGSQGSGVYSRKQIRSGCNQVSAVRAQRPPYTIGLRLVVATLLQREDQSSRSRLFVGDPEDVEPYDYEFDDDIQRLCERHHFMRVATLIGDEPLATALAAGEAVAGAEGKEREPEGVSRTIDGTPYVGSEVRVSDRRRDAGLFIGVEVGLWRAASSTKFELLPRQATVTPLGGRRARLLSQGGGRLAAVGTDGIGMEVWTAPPSSQSRRVIDEH